MFGTESVKTSAGDWTEGVSSAGGVKSISSSKLSSNSCTCLRKWRGPGTADGQEQEQQQHRRRRRRRRPRHLVHRAVPHGAGSWVAAFSQSVSPPRRLSDTGAGCFGTHVSLANRQPCSWSASAALAAEPASSFPPVCAAVAAPQQQQRRPACGAAGPGSRAPAAMMGCVM